MRAVRLTAAGRRERAQLDARSDDLARSLLAPLGDAQRARLLAAMADVERLLTAGLVAVAIEDPTSDAARFCLRAYVAELDARFDTGFDPARSRAVEPAGLTPPAGLLLVARLRGEPVGCGALKLHARRAGRDQAACGSRRPRAASASGAGCSPSSRRTPRGRGARVVRLETNRDLHEATALYRSAGYTEVAAFNDEPYAHHWFEKRLVPAGRRLRAAMRRAGVAGRNPCNDSARKAVWRLTASAALRRTIAANSCGDPHRRSEPSRDERRTVGMAAVPPSHGPGRRPSQAGRRGRCSASVGR